MLRYLMVLAASATFASPAAGAVGLVPPRQTAAPHADFDLTRLARREATGRATGASRRIKKFKAGKTQ